MGHEHKFVDLGFNYIQDTRDCSHWFYQCTECGILKYDYHGDDGNYITYYQNGKCTKTELVVPE